MSIDKRAHARVAVPINAQVVVGARETEFVVKDISRGGIFLFTNSPPGVLGSTLTLKLSLTAGIKPLVLRGRIARIIADPKGHGGATLGIGIEFTDRNSTQDQAILALLDRAMIGRGTNNRAFPRVYQVLDITCQTGQLLRGLLCDVGEGGAGLTLESPVAKDEEVTVEIFRPSLATPLKLQGWVVSSEPLERNPGKHRVGVRFGRLAAETRAELKALIASVVRR